MTSKIVVNNIEADAGVSTVTFGSEISASTFTGNVTGNVTGDVVIGAGTTSAPSLSPTGDSNTGIFFPSADTIAFAEGGAEAVRIESNGSTQIRSGYELRVYRSDNTRYGRFYTDNNASILEANASPADPLRLTSSDRIDFYAGGAQAIRLDSSGRLLVGTTASRGTATPAMLQIGGGNGTSTFNKVAIISGNNEDAGGMLLASSASNSIQIQADPDNQRASSKISFFIDGNERAAIDASANISIENNGSILFKSNGSRAYFNDASASSVGTSSIGGSTNTLFIGNAAIQVSSDIRLKENVEDTQLDALDAIARINVKDFTWNDPADTSHNNRNARGKWTGLIAQELVEVLPFVVNAPRKEEDGSIDHDSESIWTLDQSQLCPVLIKAIQQQQEVIASLEARLTALEGA